MPHLTLHRENSCTVRGISQVAQPLGLRYKRQMGAWVLVVDDDTDEAQRTVVRLADLGYEVEMGTSALRREIENLASRHNANDAAASKLDQQQKSAIVGDSPAMRDMVELISNVALADASVLIMGESGTGKEVVARSIHSLSSRQHHPFVAINCAAVPEQLLESELFGHAQGAYTGAHIAREGLFIQANGGTLFLDEIGDMPLLMQVKLLRALQERVVRPVGCDHEVPFHTGLVTATNRDLDVEIQEKRFRRDLLYRINVVTIAVPPLRARGRDVLLLAQHFLATFGKQNGKCVRGFSLEAVRMLLDYDWPGNVRELESCIERAVVLSHEEELSVEHLPEKIRDHQSSRIDLDTADPEELVTLTELEGRYIRHVLSIMGGNKSRTARVLRLDRRSLYRRLRD